MARGVRRVLILTWTGLESVVGALLVIALSAHGSLSRSLLLCRKSRMGSVREEDWSDWGVDLNTYHPGFLTRSSVIGAGALVS